MSAIELRMDHFRTLHRNIWFHVMNWVLEELVSPPKARLGVLYGHGFFFEASQIRHQVFDYARL